jgi:hypothetical protein
LKNGIGIKMDYFDFIGVKESVEEIAVWEAESMLKER